MLESPFTCSLQFLQRDLSFRELPSSLDPKIEPESDHNYFGRVSRVLYGSITIRFVPTGADKWNEVSLLSTKT
jgi:hypothetical protein